METIELNLENQEVFLESEENKLKEKCGILGIYLNKKDRTDSFNAAKMAYYGLYENQILPPLMSS